MQNEDSGMLSLVNVNIKLHRCFLESVTNIYNVAISCYNLSLMPLLKNTIIVYDQL